MNVREQVKKVSDNPAMGNIRDVLVIQLINIPVRGPATPVAQALPAVANMLNVSVLAVMRGEIMGVLFQIIQLIAVTSGS